MSRLHQCYQHIPQLSHTHTLAQQHGPRLGAAVTIATLNSGGETFEFIHLWHCH